MVRRDDERCEEIGKEVAHAVLHAVTLKITRTPYLAAWDLGARSVMAKATADRNSGFQADRLSLNPL